MDKLKPVLCHIWDKIRRLLGQSPPVAGNTIPNGGYQPCPDGEPLATKSMTDKPRYTENLDCHRDVPHTGTLPPTLPTQKITNSTKKPQNRSGGRGKDKPRPPPTKQKLSPEAKPELICREVYAYNRWEIFLVPPQDQNADVSQGETRLSKNNSGEYLLLNFTQTLMVNVRENGQNETISLYDNVAPLIFKLRKNWKGDGRQVKHMSNGYYVVFAPRDWKRIGEAPIELSGCVDDKFSAHYFFADGNGDPDGFDECASFFSQKRFSLKGEKVTDDSDMGDLFVGESLELVDSKDWEGISWVRVGEERGGGWSHNFQSNEEKFSDVLVKREGWFYVRVYDKDVRMLDGFDFRRLAGLKEILIDGRPHSQGNTIAPGSTGHTQTTVQFVGDNIFVENKRNDSGGNSHVTMTNSNTAIIASHPDADKTCWTINGKTEVVIRLPRIWWRMDNADDQVDKWRDTAFEMSRDAFRNNRNATIIVRLPSSAQKICAGFNALNQYAGVRRYKAKALHNHNDGTKRAKFQLRDFCYCREIAEPLAKESALRIRCGETEFSVVRILADAPLLPPKPEPKPALIPMQQKRFLRPVTRNKRFSRAELSESGLTITEAKRLRIAVDRRRKTKYCDNIDKLLRIQQTEN